jgi:hypothetical protein
LVWLIILWFHMAYQLLEELEGAELVEVVVAVPVDAGWLEDDEDELVVVAGLAILKLDTPFPVT